MFDDRVYKRGALLLHALRLHLGDDAFFALLRELGRGRTPTGRSTPSVRGVQRAADRQGPDRPVRRLAQPRDPSPAACLTLTCAGRTPVPATAARSPGARSTSTSQVGLGPAGPSGQASTRASSPAAETRTVAGSVASPRAVVEQRLLPDPDDREVVRAVGVLAGVQQHAGHARVPEPCHRLHVRPDRLTVRHRSERDPGGAAQAHPRRRGRRPRHDVRASVPGTATPGAQPTDRHLLLRPATPTRELRDGQPLGGRAQRGPLPDDGQPGHRASLTEGRPQAVPAAQ